MDLLHCRRIEDQDATPPNSLLGRARKRASGLHPGAPITLVAAVLAATIAPAALAPLFGYSAGWALKELYELTVLPTGKAQISRLFERLRNRRQYSSAEDFENEMQQELEAILQGKVDDPDLRQAIAELVLEGDLISLSLDAASDEVRPDLITGFSSIADQHREFKDLMNVLETAIHALGSDIRKQWWVLQEQQRQQTQLLIDQNVQAERRHIELLRLTIRDQPGLHQAHERDLESLVDSRGRPIGRGDENPYVGLRSFDRADSHLFFGRDQLVATLTSRLDASTMWVTGSSGTGKSSVLHAGLLPVIERDPRCQALEVLRPGDEPTSQLSASLDRLGIAPGRILHDESSVEVGRLTASTDYWFEDSANHYRLLLIDQFEEVFTRGAADDEVHRFLDGVARVSEVPGLRLVAALRSDFYRDVCAHPVLRAELQQTQVIVGQMSRAELTEAIVGPARLMGAEVEEALVTTAIDDIEGQPGGLPLMSHAMRMSWERSTGRRLTVGGYIKAGRAAGALNKTAEETLARLRPDDRETVRRLMLLLTDTSDEGRLASRAVPRSELSSWSDQSRVRRVMSSLSDARLLSLSESHVRIGHEALLTAWSTYQRWLQESRQELSVARHLRLTTSEWEQHGQADDVLYRGRRLSDALTISKEQPELLGPAEYVFLERSQAASRRESAERQRAARMRRTATVTGFVVVVALILLGVGLIRAQLQANEADRQARARDLIDLSIALRTIDPDMSVLLAGEATLETPGPEASVALFNALAAKPYRTRRTAPVESPILTMAVDQATGVRYTLDAGGRLYRHSDGEVLAPPVEVNVPATGFVRIEPLADLLISVDSAGVVRGFHLDSGIPIAPPFATGAPVTALTTSSDGSRIAVGNEGGDVTLLSTTDLSQQMVFAIDEGIIRSLAFSPAGEGLAIGVEGFLRIGRVLTLNLSNGTVTDQADGGFAAASVLTYDSNGQLAIGWTNGQVVVVDPGTGLLRLSFSIGSSAIKDMVFGLGDRGLIVLDQAGNLVVQGSSGNESPTFFPAPDQGPDGAVGLAMAVDHQRNVLHMSTDESGVVEWFLDEPQGLVTRLGAANPAGGGTFDRDGDRVALLGPFATIDVVDLGTGRVASRVSLPTSGALAAVLALGDDSITISERTGIGLGARYALSRWAIPSGRLIDRTENRWVDTRISLFGDVAALVEPEDRRNVMLWSLSTDRRIGPTFDHIDHDLTDVVLAGDGQSMIAADSAGGLHLWNTQNGEIVGQVPAAHPGRISTIYLTGSFLFSTGVDGLIKVWDPATLEPASTDIDAHDSAIVSLSYIDEARLLASLDLNGHLSLGALEEVDRPTFAIREVVGRQARMSLIDGGNKVAILQENGQLLVVNTNVSSWQRLACEYSAYGSDASRAANHWYHRLSAYVSPERGRR